MEYQTILITGVGGFISSNLCCYLVNKYPGTKFIGIDKMSYCSSEKNFEEIKDKPNFTFIRVDFTQLYLIDSIFDTHRPDAVIHLGAETHVDGSYSNSLSFTISNVLGTHVLLEVSNKYKIKRVFFMSTDEVYGSIDEKSHEESLICPTNPYSATKASCEHLCRAYRISYKLPVVIVRGNNVYGPRQYPEKVIPKFILRLERNLPLQIQGSGEQQRSFIYVDDMCTAIETVFLRGLDGETYNVGSDTEISIKQLASILSKIYDRDPQVKFIEDRPFNDIRYFICSEKIGKLGWKQQIGFDEGIRRTVKWYREHPDHWTPESIASAKVYDV